MPRIRSDLNAGLVALAIAFIAGCGAARFIMFGIFKDTTVMPWFTFLPALAIGPAVGVVSGAFVGYNCGRVLRCV